MSLIQSIICFNLIHLRECATKVCVLSANILFNVMHSWFIRTGFDKVGYSHNCYSLFTWMFCLIDYANLDLVVKLRNNTLDVCYM